MCVDVCGCVCVCVYLPMQARDGNSVCVALSGQDGKYVIINIQEGNVMVLVDLLMLVFISIRM